MSEKINQYTIAYYTEIPECIFNLNLDSYTFRLYCQIKKMAQNTGECICSNEELAESCGMSVTKVKQGKKILAVCLNEFNGKAVIRVENRWDVDGAQIMSKIYIE